jgi:GDP-L-fucose synthase
MTAPQVFSLAGKRVWVAGHRGMVGSALVRRLTQEDCTLLTAGRDTLDLRHQAAVESWMAAEKPQVVFLAAARVGGILANATRPAEFLYDNLMIEANIIHAAWRSWSFSARPASTRNSPRSRCPKKRC